MRIGAVTCDARERITSIQLGSDDGSVRLTLSTREAETEGLARDLLFSLATANPSRWAHVYDSAQEALR